MRAHYIQHVPFEGLGSMEPWLTCAGYEVTCTRLCEGEPLPELGALHLLIVMGGPMSVNDEDVTPWLVAEKTFIRRAIEAGLPVLGVCLGAQLIASALGARVYPNAVKEIGWFPVQGSAATHATGFTFPSEFEVFHWHGETFDLPAGAVRLASSEGCLNQAFQIGRSAIGLQFHLETTPTAAAAIVAHCGDELVPAPYVQSKAEILRDVPERYSAINELMAALLTYLTA
ncbi:MAG: C26 family cysteine hydrolase domain-containing family [Verrucomicrobia bacterium]|jgi:GMP synthase-like glutamine amidotransferase|nr:C26 family cysteine hydrolase domain-containing family [Verrucomicrobiota bacterium]MBT7067981.1 C26 family cysteine hydrolase domain-containing family [Verrucomicrobiota bacterium]MBT7699261.1 C26 family cysteine hydrolase domain-containing family [Verrucomicrobiota bacterium]